MPAAAFAPIEGAPRHQPGHGDGVGQATRLDVVGWRRRPPRGHAASHRASSPHRPGRATRGPGRPAATSVPAPRRSPTASPGGRAASRRAAPVVVEGRGTSRLGHRRGRAGAEDEALEQRVAGQPVGAVDAGARHLAGGGQARHRAPSPQVGGDAAHGVVRRGRHRNPVAGQVEAALAAGGGDGREARRGPRPGRGVRATGTPGRRSGPPRARSRATRGRARPARPPARSGP